MPNVRLKRKKQNSTKKTSKMLQPYCKICDRKHSREYYRKNYSRMKKQIRASAKKRVIKLREEISKIKEGPCADCKQSFHPCAMDFDHLPGNLKISNIGSMVGQGCGIEKILEEIKKCELVCSNCHRLRTYNRMQY